MTHLERKLKRDAFLEEAIPVVGCVLLITGCAIGVLFLWKWLFSSPSPSVVATVAAAAEKTLGVKQ
jgi:hypothetical protein